jgi:hypothetical protein
MDYQNKPQITPTTFVKTNQIIHLALLIGQLMFAVVTYVITSSKGIINFTFINNDPFTYVAILLAMGGFFLGNFLFRQELNNASEKNSLREKLMSYQAGLIKKLAPMEGASLFSIVIFMLTGNLFFLVITGLVILYFITLRPTKEMIGNDLNLSYDEKMQMDS